MPKNPFGLNPLNKEEIDLLRGVFGRAGSKISKIFINALSNPSIDWHYWAEHLDQIKDIYGILENFWTRFTNKNVPDFFENGGEVTAGLLRKMGIVSDFSRVDKQSIMILQRATNADMMDATKEGAKQIEQVFRQTQQSNIADKRISQSIAEGVGSGNKGPRQIANTLRDEIIQKIGIDNKILVAGDRNYDPADYAELVARTRMREAQTIGAKETIMGLGLDLIQISSHGSDTPICLANGAESDQVFSLNGSTPGYDVPSALPPYHPNCMHVIVPYAESAA